jgi:hypothetical protein
VGQNSVEAQHQEFIHHIFAAPGKKLVVGVCLEKKKGEKQMFGANVGRKAPFLQFPGRCYSELRTVVLRRIQ